MWAASESRASESARMPATTSTDHEPEDQRQRDASGAARRPCGRVRGGASATWSGSHGSVWCGDLRVAPRHDAAALSVARAVVRRRRGPPVAVGSDRRRDRRGVGRRWSRLGAVSVVGAWSVVAARFVSASSVPRALRPCLLLLLLLAPVTAEQRRAAAALADRTAATRGRPAVSAITAITKASAAVAATVPSAIRRRGRVVVGCR